MCTIETIEMDSILLTVKEEGIERMKNGECR